MDDYSWLASLFDLGSDVPTMLDPSLLDPSWLDSLSMIDPDVLSGIDWNSLDLSAPTVDYWDGSDAGAIASDYAAPDVDPYDPYAPTTGSASLGSAAGKVASGASGLTKLLGNAASALGGAMGGGGAAGRAGGGSLGMFGAIQPQGLPTPAIPSGGGPLPFTAFPIQPAPVPQVSGGPEMSANFAPIAPVPVGTLGAPTAPEVGGIAPFTPMASSVPLPQMLAPSGGPRPQPLTGLQRLLMEM